MVADLLNHEDTKAQSRETQMTWARKCLVKDLIESRGGELISAIEIAERVKLTDSPDRERRRRAVRAIIEKLHADGVKICACNNGMDQGGGYWMAQSDGEWTEYCEARKAGRVLDFVRIKQMRTAARERVTKQGTLFAV